MKTKHNILTKIFLILLFAAGWGSSAWAERLEPTFESAYAAGGHWYNITYWTSGNYYAAQGDGENLTYGSGYMFSPAGLWQLVGDQSSFKLVTKSGIYAKWSSDHYVGTTDAAEATAFSLIDMLGGRDDYWGIHRLDAGADQVWNPQGNMAKEYNNNDNNSSVKFVEPAVKLSSEPEGANWSANTHWYTMQNVRSANNSSGGGYAGTDGNWIDGDGNMKLRVAGQPEGKSGQWAFVMTSDGIRIYNRAKGTGYVMGTVNNVGDAATRTKMYEGTGEVANVTKTYTMGANGAGYWFCLTGGDRHLDDGSNGYLTVWNNGSGPKGSEGNRFILTEANPSVDVECTFDPATGNIVESLATISVTPTDGVTEICSAEEAGATAVMPRLVSGANAYTATSVTKNGSAYVIAFDNVNMDGEYTLQVPEGTFYTSNGGEWVALTSMTADYILALPEGTTGYQVNIIGDNDYTVTTTAALNSGSHTVHAGKCFDYVGTPVPTDLTISCTDKFVWGPTIDNTAKTITFEIRDIVSSFTAGRWYQLQMREREGTYYSPNGTGNLVDGVLKMNPRFSGRYIYLAPGNKSSNNWCVELFGKPTDAYTTYFFVPNATATTVQLQQHNGVWVNNNSILSGSAANINIEYLPANYAFWWKGPAYPWGGLSGMNAALGKAGDSAGPIEFLAHPVTFGEDYDIYKVVAPAEGELTYKGSENCFVANGALLNPSGKVASNGQYFFFPKDFTVSPADFSFGDAAAVILDISSTVGADGAKTLTVTPDYGTLDNAVNLKFVDPAGNVLSDGQVIYTPEVGTPVVLTAAEATHDFGNVPYSPSLFSSADDFVLGSVSFDVPTNTLTFLLSPNTVHTGIYRMSFSTQDRGTIIDKGTTYTTLARNAWQRDGVVADNSNSLWYIYHKSDGTYTIASLSPYSGRGEDVYFLKGAQDATFSINNPVFWQFTYKDTRARGKGNGQSQFYGGYDTTIATPNYFEIRPTSWATNKFLTGSPGYDEPNRVRQGDHEVEASYIEFSAIKETDITDPEQQVLYNRVKVHHLDGDVNVAFVDEHGVATTEVDVIYHPSDGSMSQVIDATSSTYNFNDEYFADYYASDLFSVGPGFFLTSTAYNEATNTLTFTIERDPLATDKYTVVVTNGTTADGFNVDDVIVLVKGAHYRNGKSFYTRPTEAPKATDFVVNGMDNKFVWGPVIDHTAKTITFDIRDVATEFTTGLYQMMLLEEAKINTVNGYIDMYAGDNINTSSNYIYIAPSVYGKDGAKFKFTGVPSYASEAATAVYLTNNANGTLNLEATGGAKFENVAYTFDADSHILTLTSYGPKDYGYDGTTANFEPKEMPQLTNQNGPTRYYLYAADTTPYDYYYVNLVNGSGTTTVKYNKPSLTGTTSYANNSLLVVKKGTQFTLTDFSPSDTRVISVEITDEPTSTTPGILTINLESMVSEWTGIITNSDASLDITGYQVKFNGATYASGTKLLIPAGLDPRVAVSTTCADKFVWGPLVDEDAKTITFDIREPLNVAATEGTPLTTDGWYQFQIVERAGNNFYNLINQYINGAQSRKASYYYMFNADKEYAGNGGNYGAKFAGVPYDGSDVTTYFHVTADATAPKFQLVNGHYLHRDSKSSETPVSVARISKETSDNTFGVYRMSVYDLSPEKPIIGASGEGLNFYVRAIKVDPTVANDVYRLRFVDAGGVEQTTGSVDCASSLGVKTAFAGGYFFFPKDTPITASLFTTIGYRFDGVSADADAEGIKTITFRAESGLQNMIVHRQHGVFDQLEATPEALRPTGNNHIKLGQGMLPHPYAGKFIAGVNVPDGSYRPNPGDPVNVPQIAANYIDNDRTQQNTSVFHITQYVEPGGFTKLVLPHTRDASATYVTSYQRWYNYKTERPLDYSVLHGILDESFYLFANGHCNRAPGKAKKGVLGNLTLSLPSGVDTLMVGVDGGEFTDHNLNIGNGNILEPSLNERVVYHLVNANMMASRLTKKGATPTGDQKEWWEDHTFYVPRIKRGTDNTDDNTDLLPLDMGWSYYWMYEDNGTTLLRLAPENISSNNNADYVTLSSHIAIEVEGSASSYIDVAVNRGQGGIGASPSIAANHFLCYRFKGSTLKREIPDGAQAIIKVYAVNSTGTQYQLARFTLNFISDAEPLIITSIIGKDPNAPISHRSEDYFINNGYTQVASLRFQQKEINFDYNTITSETSHNERKSTYAFPIDPTRTSYGYSANNSFGQYKIGCLTYGTTYAPVEACRRNIQNPSVVSTYINDDYLFYIDAAESPGQVASIPLEGTLCSGTRLYCYGWVGSANRYESSTPASVYLRLVGRKTSTNETKIIASYLPGMFSDAAYDQNDNMYRSLAYGRVPSPQKAAWMQEHPSVVGPWQQVGFSFTLSEADSHYDEYELQIINNCHSTAGGDYLLDDFTVYANPPRATMEFSAPLCYDHIPHLKITAPYDLLEGAQKVGGTGADKDNYRISYCFLDHKKYAAALETATTDEAKKAAFYNALMGNRTASDTYVDGKVTQYRSFWNLSIASTDAGYEAYPDYTFQSALEATSSDVTPEQAASQFATVQAAVFKQMVGSERQIVFATEIGNSLGWEVGEDYDLVFTGGWVTSDFENASNPYNLANGVNQCSYFDTFTVRPSIIVITDMEDTDYADMTVCNGQSVSMSVRLPGLGPNGKSTFLQFMQYDWWIGNGQTVKGGDTSTITPATVHNFNQEKFGSYTTATAEHAAGDPVYLITALKNFRRLYPTAIDLRVCPPKSGVDANGQDVDFTQEEWDCIDHYTQPDDNARTPLILGKRAIEFLVRVEDADADHNVYVTIIPIEPLAPFDGTENVIYCPDPQQVAIRIESDSPLMFNGFTELHDEYPSQMHSVPVRMGLEQFEETRLSNTGQMGPHHLRIPLRGIQTVNNASRGASIIKLKHEKVHASDADTYEDFIYLVGSDDPRYSDPNSEDFFMESVDENTGTVSYRPVGLVHAFNAPHDNRAHMEIGFANNFQPHEGFTYTLKFNFQESIPDDYTDAIAPCDGNFSFDLKIVPKYIQWVADEGNGDWNNDRNWARADRDALHAANAASDGTTPLAGYTSNVTNYGDDQLYTQIGTAHSFVPMYFTNVLLHDGTLLAPSLNALTPAEMSGGKYVSFVGGLNETGPNATATRFIKYDMLVTPISNTNHWQKGEATMTPLGHADRYHATNKNYGCEPYDSNVCDGLTFEPGTAMYDAQYLNYNKAWVEYELKTDRWYTLASPLQDTYAGEWYSPEAGGRQLTPHFAPITYNPAINDRFNPAYYQRSWDKAGKAWIYRMTGDEGTYLGFEHDTEHAEIVRVQKPTYLNWSYVYNDVTVPYSNGGFSVNVRYTDSGKDATGGKALVRMPKDDTAYTYYQSEASAGLSPEEGSGVERNDDGSVVLNNDGSVNIRVENGDSGYSPIPRSTSTHHRLMSDLLAPPADGSVPLTTPTINQFIVNASPTNPYYLVGNPFMAPMNMDTFFAEQRCKRMTENGEIDDATFVAGKYWILEGTKQNVSIKAEDGNWINTSDDSYSGVVAPLQGFFVQMPVDAAGHAVLPVPNPAVAGVALSFTADVQQRMEVVDTAATGQLIYGYPIGEDADANPIYGYKPTLKSRRRGAEVAQPIFRITATNGSQMESNAVVYFSDKASNAYDTREDAETLLDSNIADKVSTVFTAADETALQINSMSTHVTTIPVGVIAPTDDTRTTLTFSGLAHLEAVMGGTPHLYDAADDTFQVLDEDTAVAVTGTTFGRYFIVSGMTLPFAEEAAEEAGEEAATSEKAYNLHGVRVATPQHGNVTIRGSRKEYNR